MHELIIRQNKKSFRAKKILIGPKSQSKPGVKRG